MPLPGDDTGGVQEINFSKINSETTKKYYELVENYNRKHLVDPFLPKPATITLGQDFLLNGEDIAKASIDGFSQCFTYQEDVEEFEIKNGIVNSGQTTSLTSKGYSVPLTVVGDTSADAAAATIEDAPVIQTDELKPWLIADPNDPSPKYPWYIPARYFARQLVIDNSTLLTKRDSLASKVALSLTNAGIFKRGEKLPFSPGTVLKAFANVTLG